MFKQRLLPLLLLALLCLVTACGENTEPKQEIEPKQEDAPESRLLSEVFQGADTSALNGAVQRPETSVDNGEFKLTLEEYLVSDFQVLLSFTVEALTDQAKAELFQTDESSSDVFWETHEAKLSNMVSISHGGGAFSNLDEYATETSQYAIIERYNLQSDGSPLLLTVGDLSLEVPMTPNIPTTRIDVEQDDVLLHLQYNAIGVSINCIKDTDENDVTEKTQNEVIYFRTAEGDLKTYNELFDIYGWTSVHKSTNGNKVVIRRCDRFKQPPQEGEFTSIIIGGKEFSLTDGEYLGDYTK